MPTAWEDQHRRARALRHVLAQLEADPNSPTLPWDDESRNAFSDPDDLLQALHRTWLHRLLARVDQALEMGDQEEPADLVAQARLDASRHAPGLRRLLDAHAAAPALQRSLHTERRLLAMATFSPPATHADVSPKTQATMTHGAGQPHDWTPQRSIREFARRLAGCPQRPAAAFNH